jgi:hypothetical protein
MPQTSHVASSTGVRSAAPAMPSAAQIQIPDGRLREFLYKSHALPQGSQAAGSAAAPMPTIPEGTGSATTTAGAAAATAATAAAAAGASEWNILGLPVHWFALIIGGLILAVVVGWKIYQWWKSKQAAKKPKVDPAQASVQAQRLAAQSQAGDKRDYMTAKEVRELIKRGQPNQQ